MTDMGETGGEKKFKNKQNRFQIPARYVND